MCLSSVRTFIGVWNVLTTFKTGDEKLSSNQLKLIIVISISKGKYNLSLTTKNLCTFFATAAAGVVAVIAGGVVVTIESVMN